MASLSEKLRRERELRGISLKQISDDTKIGVRFLEALEEDKLELIPGEFYRRSYLRAYARYLGLDEDRAVNAYAYANQEKQEEVEGTRKPAGMAPWLPWVLGACAVFIVVVLYLRAYVSSAKGESTNSGAPASMTDVASAATDDGEPAAAPSAEPASDEIAPPPTLSVTNDVPTLAPSRSEPPREPPVSAPSTGALRFVVAVTEACWLEIEADGDVVTTGLKDEGYRSSFSADSEVRLWLGNAGGVSLWVNDRPLRSLGRPGQVRKDVSITPDNYLNFVTSSEGPS